MKTSGRVARSTHHTLSFLDLFPPQKKHIFASYLFSDFLNISIFYNFNSKLLKFKFFRLFGINSDSYALYVDISRFFMNLQCQGQRFCYYAFSSFFSTLRWLFLLSSFSTDKPREIEFCEFVPEISEEVITESRIH